MVNRSTHAKHWYLIIHLKQHKTRKRHVRCLLMRVKVHRCVRYILMTDKACTNDVYIFVFFADSSYLLVHNLRKQSSSEIFVLAYF